MIITVWYIIKKERKHSVKKIKRPGKQQRTTTESNPIHNINRSQEYSKKDTCVRKKKFQ